ncbi:MULTISPECIES: M20/M25/M40 family metallo-hydrolase [Bacillus]|uniref:M20/M25/M40 family metallo-hydrolase n=1 Tax=Bacillus TaxID=1386 RepID=UPI000309B6E6|nr:MULTISPECIES: M20/M25/M40 family metallo-hydrolase [Bacillus]
MDYANSLQSTDKLKELLYELVSVASVTLSDEEKVLPLLIQQHLMKIPYFQQNPTHLENHPTSDGRLFTTALYQHPEATKTVVLISHFDVVSVEDYGDLKHLAFQPLELTKELHVQKAKLPFDAQQDLESGDWLFGRGTMDMKLGLVQHMHLLEKASMEQWKINLLLVTVPDEEVNSVGMREAIPKLVELSKIYELTYTLFLNSEPMFTQTPGDLGHYFYTGSIGKILPSVLCFGKETHVGEPLSGINAAWMSSVLSQEMEWNEQFCEKVNAESTPPPTILWQRDLKKEYSVQIPHRSVSMYNLMLMKKNPAEVMASMKEIANKAAEKMEKFIEKKFQALHLTSHTNKIRVISYEELKEYACQKTSASYIADLEKSYTESNIVDYREKVIHIVDQIAILCQELAPMMVIFYAPPYYPAVYSGDNPTITELSNSLIEYTKQSFGYDLKPIEYFNGISDLSYVSLQAPLSDMNKYHSNAPGNQNVYPIPFEEMAQFTAPVLNVGPVGRDAHKKTERLYMPFAFEQLPKMLEHIIKTHEKQDFQTPSNQTKE